MSQGLGWTPSADIGSSGQSASIPGLYNSAGLTRFFRQRQNAGKTAAGVGMGGCGIRLIGDSFMKGYNQTHAIRDVFAFQLHKMMQATQWQADGVGGRGYVGGRAGSTAWPGGAATLSGQGIWTFDANWTLNSAASINNLRSTTTSGQVRIFMDPSDPNFREACTDIAIVHGTEAVAGTLTWDLKFAATDTGFFTAGTGDLTGTIDMNATASGGIYNFPASLQGMTGTLTSPFILQISRTAGTIYFEGAHFFNGDKSCGFNVQDCSRTGAATGDATFPGGTPAKTATINAGCSFGSTVNTCTALYVFGYAINDCSQSLSIDSFQTQLETLATLVDSASTQRSCVLHFINPCLFEGLHTNTPPWNSYKAAIKEVASGISYYSVLDMDEFIGNPDTQAEVDVYEAFPFLYSSEAAKHPSNEGAIAMASLIRNALCLTEAA